MGYAYGKTSTRRLNSCDPRLQLIMNVVIKITDTSILEGERQEEKQDRYVALGYSKIKWPFSKHNVKLMEKTHGAKSQACDAGPYPIVWPNKKTRPDTYTKDVGRWYMFCGIVKAVAHDLGIPVRLGCDWDNDGSILDQDFDDLPHIELVEPFDPLTKYI